MSLIETTDFKLASNKKKVTKGSQKSPTLLQIAESGSTGGSTVHRYSVDDLESREGLSSSLKVGLRAQAFSKTEASRAEI